MLSCRPGGGSGPGPDTGDGGEGLAPLQPPLQRRSLQPFSSSLSGPLIPQPQPAVHVKSSLPIPVLSPHGQEGREGGWGSRARAPTPLGGTQQVEAPPGSLAPREHPGVTSWGSLLHSGPARQPHCPHTPLTATSPLCPGVRGSNPITRGVGASPARTLPPHPQEPRQLPPVAVLSAGQVSPRPGSKAWLPGLWQQRAARLRKASHHVLLVTSLGVSALTLLGSAAGPPFPGHRSQPLPC